MDDMNTNLLVFSDDPIPVASTEIGLQILLDKTVDFLESCDLRTNNGKSFTIAIKNVPHIKKSIIDANTHFKC